MHGTPKKSGNRAHLLYQNFGRIENEIPVARLLDQEGGNRTDCVSSWFQNRRENYSIIYCNSLCPNPNRNMVFASGTWNDAVTTCKLVHKAVSFWLISFQICRWQKCETEPWKQFQTSIRKRSCFMKRKWVFMIDCGSPKHIIKFGSGNRSGNSVTTIFFSTKIILIWRSKNHWY